MLDFKFEVRNGMGILKLEGDLTANSAEEISETLNVSLSNSDHLVLNFSAVTNINSSLLKQIEAANEISRRCNKRLSMINLHPDLLIMDKRMTVNDR